MKKNLIIAAISCLILCSCSQEESSTNEEIKGGNEIPNGIDIQTINSVDVGPMFATINSLVENKSKEIVLNEKGIVWSYVANPNINDNIIIDSEEINNTTYAVNLYCLNANSNIYVKAYLKTNDNIYYYGNELIFKTKEHKTYPQSISFNSQETFDNFIKQGYSKIQGNMSVSKDVFVSSISEISGDLQLAASYNGDIANFNGPSCLKKFNNIELIAYNGNNAVNNNILISGFEDVTECNNITIKGSGHHERKLKNLIIDGFNNLEKVENLSFKDNRLTSIDLENGFKNLVTIQNDLTIRGQSPYGFGALYSIDLRTFKGLDNVKKIGNNLIITGSSIRNFDALTRLQSANNISIYLPRITNFSTLSNLSEITSTLEFTDSPPYANNAANNSETKYKSFYSFDYNVLSTVKKIGLIKNHNKNFVNSSFQGFSNLENINKIDINTEKFSSLKGLDNIIKIDSLKIWSENVTNFDGLENIKELAYLNVRSKSLNNVCGLRRKIDSLLVIYPDQIPPNTTSCAISSERVILYDENVNNYCIRDLINKGNCN